MSGDTMFPDIGIKMPALFVGHGNPMNAIEENEFSRAWAAAAKLIPTPRAILCISAHWETDGTAVTASDRPETIHDFGGFPPELYRVQYPSPGLPALAELVRETVRQAAVAASFDRGLDHGAWSVLCRMFPNADVPVVQLSLDRTKAPAFHYGLGKELKELRSRGVLIVGSGNIVHNLGMVEWQDTSYDWAVEFDARIQRLVISGDHDALIHYEKIGRVARLAIPTNEHYLPLLYVLALQEKNEKVGFFAEKVTMGSLSMRSLMIG